MTDPVPPVLSGDDFLRDVEQARESTDELHIWWMGQSGFLVMWQDRSILFDPYLSDSLTEKYAATDKPHVRMTGRVIDPARLDFIDVATSSHNHTDHLDAATLNPLRSSSRELDLIIPEANRDFVVERLGCPPDWPTGADAGRSVQVGGVTFTGIPAAHEDLDTDEEGRYRFLGYVLNIGPWTIYHSGDTIRYEGMADLLRPFHIDVAMLPINGRSPERRVAGNLSGSEAAALASEVHARMAIPCHFDMFVFNTASPESFRTNAERLGQQIKVLGNGERLSLGVSSD
jgi:L-ascorbate metabolism protein UlaG (beta-lactamase superfamily)